MRSPPLGRGGAALVNLGYPAQAELAVGGWLRIGGKLLGCENSLDKLKILARLEKTAILEKT